MSSGVVQSLPTGTQRPVVERALQLPLLLGLLPWKRGAGVGDPSGCHVPQDRGVSGPRGGAALLLHGDVLGGPPAAEGEEQLHTAAVPGRVARSPVLHHLLHRGLMGEHLDTVCSVSLCPAVDVTLLWTTTDTSVIYDKYIIIGKM